MRLNDVGNIGMSHGSQFSTITAHIYLNTASWLRDSPQIYEKSHPIYEKEINPPMSEVCNQDDKSLFSNESMMQNGSIKMTDSFSGDEADKAER